MPDKKIVFVAFGHDRRHLPGTVTHPWSYRESRLPTYISGSGFVVGVAARSVPLRAGRFDSWFLSPQHSRADSAGVCRPTGLRSRRGRREA